MKIYIGETGLNETFQEPFPKAMKCNKCGANSRIMFVGAENYPEDKGNFICELHDNMKDNKYWPHDAIAIASYLCENCFEVTSIMNQA